MKIAVIILNWNGALDTIACVRSVLLQDISTTFDIYVLDNNSSTDQKEILLKEFSDNASIHFRLYNENFGFGVAHNMIFEELSLSNKYEYWALINNDAIADKQWLSSGIDAQLREDADVVACKMIQFYNQSFIDSAGLYLLNTGEILPRGHGETIEKYNSDVQDVISFCAGACILKSSLYQELGGFDEYFQTGYEDAELGLRYFLANKKILYVPQSFVYHKGSVSVTKIADLNRAIKIQKDIHYTVLKLLPLSVLIFNFAAYITRTLLLLFLHIFTFRFVYIRIWFVSIKSLIFKDVFLIYKKRRRVVRRFREIVQIQNSFLMVDLMRFNKYILKKKKNHFEKMVMK